MATKTLGDVFEDHYYQTTAIYLLMLNPERLLARADEPLLGALLAARAAMVLAVGGDIPAKAMLNELEDRVLHDVQDGLAALDAEREGRRS